mmetsp:Transcript_78198/g.130449  ORF Transcript_78198/g.130449 Transcript_78198/m.130449 type:complete len:543 (+) Transcript_78198:1918-3546(+)
MSSSLQRCEMLLELPLQLQRLCMIWVHIQSLGGQRETLLEVSQFERQQPTVEEGLVHVLRQTRRRLEVGAGLVHVALAELQDPQIVEGLGVVGVHGNGHLERLIRQSQIANADGHLPDVVPNIRHVLVAGKRQSPLEAGQRHVVLGAVKAAQPQVVPELRVVDTHLKQPPVQAQSNFGVVVVEVVAGQAGDTLDIAAVQLKCLLVVQHRVVHVIQHVMDAGNGQKQMGVLRVYLNTLLVDLQRGQRLIQFHVHFAELQERDDHFLVLQGRLELSLGVSQQPQLVVALAEAGLPPPTLVVAHNGGQRRQLQGTLGVVVVVQDVVGQDFGQRLPLGVLLEVQLIGVHEGASGLAAHAGRPQPHEPPALRHRARCPGAAALERHLHAGGHAPTGLAARAGGPGARAGKPSEGPASGSGRADALLAFVLGRCRAGAVEGSTGAGHVCHLILVQEKLGYALVLHLGVINPVLHSEGTALDVPHTLIIWIFLEQLCARRDAAVKVALPQHGQAEPCWVQVRGHRGGCGHGTNGSQWTKKGRGWRTEKK